MAAELVVIIEHTRMWFWYNVRVNCRVDVFSPFRLFFAWDEYRRRCMYWCLGKCSTPNAMTGRFEKPECKTPIEENVLPIILFFTTSAVRHEWVEYIEYWMHYNNQIENEMNFNGGEREE